LNRRRFLAASAASFGAAAGWRSANSIAVTSHPVLSGSAVAPLSAVRRMIVERMDPLLGRCRYVADLGGGQVAHPVLLARRGDRFDAIVERA
jgi:hypothetical protein